MHALKVPRAYSPGADYVMRFEHSGGRLNRFAKHGTLLNNIFMELRHEGQ